MRLVVTIQEILVTVSEKKKEFNNTSYVERIGYTGNEKKICCTRYKKQRGRTAKKIVHTMRQLSGPKPF